MPSAPLNDALLIGLAVVSLGLACAGLLGGPRLRLLRPEPVIEPSGPTTGGPWLALRKIPPARWRFGLLAGLVCWLGLRSSLTGMLVGVVAVPVSIALLGWLEGQPERRRQHRLVAQLPECLDLLSAALRAGVPLRAAATQVAGLVPEPSAAVLRGVLGHLQIGRSDAQAWATLRTHSVWGPAARDLARSADSGAGMAEALQAHAAEARTRRQASRELAARTVGVRSILPLVSCFLPAFILVGVLPIIAATIGSFLQGTS